MRLPNDQQHLSIMGATGSGKTHAALHHLSFRSYDVQPWIVYNFKRDESIDSIPGAKSLELDEIPQRPGIYIAHPLPNEQDAVETQMWGIWHTGDTGVYVDEGYMVGRNNEAFRALLTQGRSKYIPLIVLTQRPVWLDNFVLSESGFVQVFRLQHAKDRRTIEQVVPADMEKRLPRFHSHYYDVAEDDYRRIGPAPPIASIYRAFYKRMEAARGRVKAI